MILWLDSPASYSDRRNGYDTLPAHEDVMIFRVRATLNRALLVAVSAALVIDISAASAQEVVKRKPINRVSPNSTAYGPGGPNVSYQQGPRTRVFITKRSWLDA